MRSTRTCKAVAGLSLGMAALLLGTACGDDGNGNHADEDGGPVADASVPVPPDAATVDCTPTSGTTVAELRLQEVVSGLSHPVFVTAPPGDTRLFVIEQPGRIRIVKDGTLLTEPFLDLTDVVENGGSEEGLLGLAFDPDWAHNGKFYVDFTRDADGGSNTETVIGEYRVAAVDDDTADPSTFREVLTVDQPFHNHNGGMIAFGPDGYLYIGMGDGGSGGDPNGNGQDPSTLLAAILRIDPHVATGHAIPDDNPFADGMGGAPEVYAYGLRNPWRWSFDRMTDDLYIGDVGQNRVEEIDAVPLDDLAGANFGWNTYEGDECFNVGGDPKVERTGCDPQTGITPIAVYGHTSNNLTPTPDEPLGDSITGGYVYRGTCIPDIQGSYFYGDFVTSVIRTLTWTPGDTSSAETTLASIKTGADIQGVSSFGEDGFGELYLLSYANGILYKFTAP